MHQVATEAPIEVQEETQGKGWHAVRPSSIKPNASHHLRSVGDFEDHNLEEVAYKFLFFFQHRLGGKDHWVSFTLAKINNFFKMMGWQMDQAVIDFLTNHPELIFVGRGGEYRITELFIEKCSGGTPEQGLMPAG